MTEGRFMTPSPETSSIEEIAERVRAVHAENNRLFNRLLEGEKRFRRLAKAVWQVQEEERRRLALELHDGIGQTLTALKNHLQRERGRVADDAQREALDRAFELAAAALADTRELSRLLRPPVLDDLGLKAALDWLARMHAERAGLRVDIDWQPADERLASELETLAFRAVQEALTNVVKHANARQARVTVTGGEMLYIEVADDGTGFDAERAFDARRGDGFGLRGLRDRVELFGGRMEVRAREPRGTLLRIAVPNAEAATQ